MLRALFILGLSALTLSACASGVTPPAGPATSPGILASAPPVADTVATPAPTRDITTAAGLGVVRGPQIATLQVDARKAARAMDSFRTSCPGLVRRSDNSGLTQNSDWVAACDAVKTWTNDAISFFATHMDAVQVGNGKAYATGYFEPEIAGCRMLQAGCDVPVYKRPSDLIDVDLGQFSDELKGRSIRGKVSGTKLLQYDDRATIENGSLAGRGLEIAYASDVVEFFFLQIQGSGRLKLPDGNVMRIGYDSQNGRGYTGIGRLMRDRGLITDASMQGIVAFLHANPEEGRKIMQENKSYIFFRELTGAGPLGAMGYPVVGEASIAVDVKFIPLGAPVWLSMDRAEPNGIWIAQDTGGAIKGANRIDTFWGAGERARVIAGGMSARGAALLFLPKAAVARLGL
ncbi:MltA domain-containing protein [Sphingorhabdus sp. EL138]|uniref:murein transglycosylase A n=1 Tax=Sphingorhabdus sp. EL138 TaxID=2073156 RepID=UPI0025D76EFE|nr:MltA domain-containing protein [Sphingorhabdus sp. EL138]